MQGVEDVAAAGHVGQGLLLAGPQPRGEVGDGGVGAEAAVAQLQQAHAPGVGVAVLFQAEQVAVGGSDVDADQDGLAGLEDLVVGADADGGRGPGWSLSWRAVATAWWTMLWTVPSGQGVVEEVGEQFGDAAERSCGR